MGESSPARVNELTPIHPSSLSGEQLLEGASVYLPTWTPFSIHAWLCHHSYKDFEEGRIPHYRTNSLIRLKVIQHNPLRGSLGSHPLLVGYFEFILLWAPNHEFHFAFASRLALGGEYFNSRVPTLTFFSSVFFIHFLPPPFITLELSRAPLAYQFEDIFTLRRHLKGRINTWRQSGNIEKTTALFKW